MVFINESQAHDCPQCGKKVLCESKLLIHLRVHTGEKPFSCSHCDYKCSRSYNLKRHEKSTLVINHLVAPSVITSAQNQVN